MHREPQRPKHRKFRQHYFLREVSTTGDSPLTFQRRPVYPPQSGETVCCYNHHGTDGCDGFRHGQYHLGVVG